MEEMLTNWVILIDCTEIMAKKDFKPNRFQVALKGVQKFIQMKFKHFPDEFLSVYLFSDKTQLLSQLSRDSNPILKQLMSSKFMKTHKPSGNGDELFFALEHAVEMIRSQIQLIGGQRSRIILITGQEKIPRNEGMDPLLKVMQGLDIFLDIFLFSTKNSELKKNYNHLLKYISGQFHEITHKKEYFKEIVKYAKNKNLLDERPAIKLSTPEEKKQHLVEIAKELRYGTEQEINQTKDPMSSIRCQICFQKKSPINNKSLTKSGRYCPHCGIPMHLYCAGLWTEKTDEGANLFRCPYCYTLLKVPQYILKGIRSQKELEKVGDKTKVVVKMIREKSISPNISQKECAYCFTKFSYGTDKKIFHCSHCHALYHVSCLEKMYKKGKVCSNCSRKIV